MIMTGLSSQSTYNSDEKHACKITFCIIFVREYIISIIQVVKIIKGGRSLSVTVLTEA